MNNKPELVTIFGRPGNYKTSFMICSVNYCLEFNKKVLFFSLEHSLSTISDRLDNGPLFTYDYVIKDMQEVYDYVNEIRPDCVFVDYLELLPNRNQAIKELRRIVDEFKIKVFVNSQLGIKFEKIKDGDEIEKELKDDLAYKLSDRIEIY